MSDDRPTCDYCGEPGYARYKHRRQDRWIDVCAQCNPTATGQRGRDTWLRFYHTERHLRYPAETPSEVQNPNAFIRGGGQ